MWKVTTRRGRWWMISRQSHKKGLYEITRDIQHACLGVGKKSLFMTQTCSSLSISIHGIKEHFFLHFVIPETFSVLSAGSKTYHVVQIKWINVRLISRTCKSVQKGIILPSSRLQMRRGLWDKANNFLTSSNYVIPPTTTTFSHILDALREKNPSCVISCVSDDKSLALTVCH